jgi:hypothetical protein
MLACFADHRLLGLLAQIGEMIVLLAEEIGHGPGFGREPVDTG